MNSRPLSDVKYTCFVSDNPGDYWIHDTSVRTRVICLRLFAVPTNNVATVDRSACVIEGVSRSRNALLNGDTRNYDWDSGYTCHQLGSGAIVVQLAQPYIIGSMRYVCACVVNL